MSCIFPPENLALACGCAGIAQAVRIGSLCSGYGGLDMTVASVTGGEIAWCADNARAPSIVIAARYGVPNLGDIKRIDWRTVEPVDIITAGYPCQPFSAAGRRKGTADARHIWPFIADAVRHIRPPLVFLENVANHRRIGFGDVLGDLAKMRFSAEWTSIRASDVGAAHRRERIFVLAYPSDRTGARPQRDQTEPTWWTGFDRCAHPTAADTGSQEQPRRPGLCAEEQTTLWRPGSRDGADDDCFDWQEYGPAVDRWAAIIGRRPPRPVVRGANGGKAVSARFIEWHMGLPAGWVTDVQGLTRTEQIELLGNGVIPQQAEAALRSLVGAGH
ncbi:MAG: (cytosine-5)-methyltransferase 1 [Mycobacterium sp.]|nr:(cytosine-5)-methyltransferase 1 [Mycobacterium sp.]